MLSEISPVQKDKCVVFALFCGILNGGYQRLVGEQNEAMVFTGYKASARQKEYLHGCIAQHSEYS